MAADDVIATALAMNAHGINQGTAGNVSERTDDGLLITPSAVAYADLTSDDVVAMHLDGSWQAAPGRHPSSEWRFHRDIYLARADIGAIVHTHSTAATAIAVHGRSIPAFHYMVAVAGGGDIRCADYATFGTQQLSDNAVAALDGRQACLLAHHGVVACGPSLTSALALAVEVEALAAQYLAASALGEPPLLTDGQMSDVLAKFGAPDGYGSS